MLPVKRLIAAFVIIAVASTTAAAERELSVASRTAQAKQQIGGFTFDLSAMPPKTKMQSNRSTGRAWKKYKQNKNALRFSVLAEFAVSKSTHKTLKTPTKRILKHKTPSKAFFPLTTAERDKVERVVMASCGELNDSLMAKANAQVILDRVKCGRFGKNVDAVLDAPCQFEKPWKGRLNAIVKNAVSAVFDRGERVIGQRIYYYENPHFSGVGTAEWSCGKRYVATIGHGYFIHEYWTDKC